MSGVVLYVLLFCTTLPSPYRADFDYVDHNHHVTVPKVSGRLDTNPEELRPVRPHRRTTTQRSITVKDEFKLPEPPYRPMTNRMSDTHDSEYDYDSYDSYNYDSSFTSASANPTAYMGSGAIHEHADHYPDSPSTEVVADYKEHWDHSGTNDGHKDHLKNLSAGIGCAWKIMVLSLFLIKMVALI